jgi:hypothetical protein
MKDELQSNVSASAGMVMSPAVIDTLVADGTYHVECIGSDGVVKWTDVIHNIVTTVGKNDILDKYLAGAAYTQTIRMGLKGVGVAVVGDTQASHASWTEQGLANAPTYTGNRPSPTFAAAAAGSKATSAAVSFAITSTGTVGGCFINNGGSATKDDTTGVLLSAGDFSAGSRAVQNGDTLNVTYSLAV